MRDDERFYRVLADIPALPPDLYGSIERAIDRRRNLRRVLCAMAAALVLCVAGVGIVNQHRGVSTSITPDIADELQTIHDYVNGNDIGQDIDRYMVAYDEE